MSDVMLLGVLRMPPDCWIPSPLDVAQRHSYYKSAADRIEADAATIERLRGLLQSVLTAWLEDAAPNELQWLVDTASAAATGATVQPTTHAQHVAARDQMITDMFKTTRERCGLTTDQPTAAPADPYKEIFGIDLRADQPQAAHAESQPGAPGFDGADAYDRYLMQPSRCNHITRDLAGNCMFCGWTDAQITAFKSPAITDPNATKRGIAD